MTVDFSPYQLANPVNPDGKICANYRITQEAVAGMGQRARLGRHPLAVGKPLCSGIGPTTVVASGTGDRQAVPWVV